MKTKDVKKIIQDFAKEEFIQNPDSYPSKAGTLTTCGVENLSQWAMNMWESRNDEEIQRDFTLGLHPDIYLAWAFEAFRL